MQAIVYERYGSPDVLELRDIDKPQVTDEGALIRVHAASVNALDWHTMRGKPYIARLSDGLRRPKSHALGVDVAGIVEAVGPNVSHVKPGDSVYGSRLGAFAEYVNGRNFAPMPTGLTFEQAAAIPTAGMTALQGLRDKGALQAGQRVLVNGAGGGVGGFAVQIAKAYGADVTGVTHTGSVEMVGSIGADRVIDYTRDDFTRGSERYDLILDAGGSRSVSAMRRVLTPDGTIVIVAPGPGQWIGPIVRVLGAVVTSRFSSRHAVPFLAAVRKDDLMVLKELIEAGKVRPVVDRTYPLRETPEAIRYLEAGRVAGKVVITV